MSHHGEEHEYKRRERHPQPHAADHADHGQPVCFTEVDPCDGVYAEREDDAPQCRVVAQWHSPNKVAPPTSRDQDWDQPGRERPEHDGQDRDELSRHVHYRHIRHLDDVCSREDHAGHGPHRHPVGRRQFLWSELVEHEPQRDEYAHNGVQEDSDQPGHDRKQRKLPASCLEDEFDRCGGDGDRLARDHPDEPGAVRCCHDRPLLSSENCGPRHDIAEHQPGDPGKNEQGGGRAVVALHPETHTQHVGTGHEREETEATLRVLEIVLGRLAVGDEAPGGEAEEYDERARANHQEDPRDRVEAVEAHADGDDTAGHDEGEVARREPLDCSAHTSTQCFSHRRRLMVFVRNRHLGHTPNVTGVLRQHPRAGLPG